MGDYVIIKVSCSRKEHSYNKSLMGQFMSSLESYFEEYFTELKSEKGINDHIYNYDESGLRFNCIGDIGRRTEHLHISKILAMAGDLNNYEWFDIVFFNLEDDEISKYDAIKNKPEPKQLEVKEL